MSYILGVAPWAVILVYLITFAVVAVAFQSVNFNALLKTQQKQMGIVIYLIISIAISFLVGSFILMIIGASSASVNGVTSAIVFT